MIRFSGVCLILLAAALYLIEEKRADQRSDRTVQDILAAVENIGTLIRWEKQTLPDSIAAQKKREYAGQYFSQMEKMLQSDITLQNAWKSTFSAIEPVEISKILCTISLFGDSTFLVEHFSFAAAQIKEFQAQKRAEQRTKRKLKVTAVLCCAGTIIILLL